MSSFGALLKRLKCGRRRAKGGINGTTESPPPCNDDPQGSGPGTPEEENQGTPGVTHPELAPLEPRLFLAATVVSGFSDVTAHQNQSAILVSLAGHFDDPDLVGTMVNIDTVMGNIPVELFNVANGPRTAAPLTVANFLHHANNDILSGTTRYSSYNNTIFHRSVPGSVDPVTHLDPLGQSGFVIQGGGFDYPNFDLVPEGPTVVNEYSATRSNLRGTVAMAKKGSDPNSATNQFFFNLSDNSTNLDNQNGGFTVFGRVVGTGMNVVDAMAALPTYNGTGIDPAFDSLPLRNTPPAQAGPDNIVLTRSIAVTSELTYTVTTDIPSIVYASVQGTTLTLNFMPNQTGTGHVTVSATSLGGGAPVSSTFTVTVQAAVNPPSIQTLRGGPDPVVRGAQTLTLEAVNVLDVAGGGVTKVEFFRDSNGNGLFEPGTDQLLGTDTNGGNGWSITVLTDGWTPGHTAFFARAQDTDNNGSPPREITVAVGNIPPTLAKIYPMGTLLRNQTGWISYELLGAYSSGLGDPNGDALQFRIEQISSGTMEKSNVPVQEGVTLLGPGEVVTWTPALNAVGALPAFTVRAWDGAAASDTAVQVTIIIDKPPVITGVAVTQIISMPGGPVTFLAKANDTDGEVRKMEFFYDTNNNGTFDEGTDLKLGQDTQILGNWNLTTSATTSFRTGVAKFFARATDNTGGYSDIYTFTAFVNTPPNIASVLSSPEPLITGTQITLTAVNVTDAGTGKVTGVQFFRDANGDGSITAIDKLLGNAALVAGTSNWALTIPTDGFVGGANKIIARAIDNNGGAGTKTGTATINNAPTIASMTTSGTVLRGAKLTLTITNVQIGQPGTQIAKIEFFLDLNGNGIVDAADKLLGTRTPVAGTPNYALETSTAGFPAGDRKFIGRATDNLGHTAIATVTSTITNNLPTVAALAPSAASIARGSPVLLTAQKPADVDGKIAKVEFWLDKAPLGTFDPAVDTKIGEDANGLNGYTLSYTVPANAALGAIPFYARAIDNDGGAGAAVGASITAANRLPTIGSLAVTPNPATQPATITLTAGTVANLDGDGLVQRVRFYEDVNKNKLLDAADRLLGEDTNGANGWSITLPSSAVAYAGTVRFLAVAEDNDGSASVAKYAHSKVNPHRHDQRGEPLIAREPEPAPRGESGRHAGRAAGGDVLRGGPRRRHRPGRGVQRAQQHPRLGPGGHRHHAVIS
ncbi:MAG: peptidylprolyl isomerase [Planctomycetota bacterium]|nr:peptidylprolyl isomerase [Planctomycetota bacterium]